MKSNVLKIGFIGGSSKSAVGYTHYIASQMDHRWHLESGCFSRNSEINTATADAWGVDRARTYSNWKEMLDCEVGKLDAVVVLTPTDQHTEIVVYALNKGFNVICEKALTSSITDAQLIIEAQHKNKNFMAVTYNYSGYPMIRELANIIANGDLGEINQVHIEMPQEGFARLNTDGSLPQPQNWRLNDQAIPTISLDLGVHVHNLIFLLTGKRPVKVIADQSRFGWFDNVLDNVICIAKYNDGMKSSIWYSKSALGHRNGLKVRVFGDKQSAEWIQINPEDLILYGLKGEKKIIDRASETGVAGLQRYNRFKAGHPAGFIEAFANLYVDIAEGLESFKANKIAHQPWVFGPEIALEGLKFIDAINKSSKSESWCIIDS